MLKDILVPDIGAFSNVEIIEILVKINDKIAKDGSLITLETDKATMEIPSPFAGIVKNIYVKMGDKVSKGDKILSLEVEEGELSPPPPPPPSPASGRGSSQSAAVETSTIQKPSPTPQPLHSSQPFKPPLPFTGEGRGEGSGKAAHAGPGVRRFARELGVDLTRVSGSGRKNRVLPSDVKAYVKMILTSGSTGVASEGGIAPWPDIDHAKFGPVKIEPLSRIQKLSGSFLLRNWARVPHVTQFDEADITALEQFRKESQTLAEQQGIKLTPLAFIMKAVIAALKAFPKVNSSLDASGKSLIYKQYFHIGVAVDTPNGLVVPVIRDVDQKGLFQLAKELAEMSAKARAGKLTAEEMQGSSFTITSLGGIGGTAFTPIINVPDVAILGVSRSQMKPIFKNGEFVPRLMLPLSLSYDHRVIDGAEGARFTTFLVEQLSDIRRLLL